MSPEQDVPPILGGGAEEPRANASPSDWQKLSRDELLQELQLRQRELEQLRSQYFDLYELAPLGLLRLTGTGLLLEANLAAANLLHVERGQLVNRPFDQWVSAPYRQHWRRLCASALAADGRQALDLELAHGDGSRSLVHADCWRHVSPGGKVTLHLALTGVSPSVTTTRTSRRRNRPFACWRKTPSTRSPGSLPMDTSTMSRRPSWL